MTEQISTTQENNPEGFHPVTLEVESPDPHHDNFKITFTCGDIPSCSAYNRAINEVAEKKGLNPFHQSGGSSTFEHSPGWHMWELFADTDAETVRALFDEIHSLAADVFSSQRQMGLHEIWQEREQ